MRQNRHYTKMYVVHHDTLTGSFWIQIAWFQPKQDSDRIRISLFKDRIGSDSKKHYPIISAHHMWSFRPHNPSTPQAEKINLPRVVCPNCLISLRSSYTRGGRSHFFKLQLHSCSKIFESGSGSCCCPLLKKTATHLGQLRKSTGEFGRSAQGTPKLTITKLRPARFARHAQFITIGLYSLMVLLK